MSAKYRVCVVGLTGIGAGKPPEESRDGYGPIVPHSHAAAYSMVPKTEVVGVCDLRQEPLDEFRKDWSEALPDLKYYIDCKEMIAELQPDIISVVTSDNRHADIVDGCSKRRR